MKKDLKKENGIEGFDLGRKYLESISKEEYVGRKPITATHGKIKVYEKQKGRRKIPSLGIKFYNNNGYNPPSTNGLIEFPRGSHELFFIDFKYKDGKWGAIVDFNNGVNGKNDVQAISELEEEIIRLLE